MKILLVTVALLAITGCASNSKSFDEHRAKIQRDIDASQARVNAMIAADNQRRAESLRYYKEAREKQEQLEAACAVYSKQTRSVSPQEIVLIEDKVKYDLKDQWSARFRNVARASQYSECLYGTQYVGEVNAKNSHGGYTGFTKFTVGRNGVTM